MRWSLRRHPNGPAGAADRASALPGARASLRRFGQQKPVVVQASTRFVVAGNHLVRAAQALGWAEIAANVVELDDATAIAYMLADNRTSDLGGYDDALLAAILAEQSAVDNLAATGYDPADVAALLRAAGLDDRDPDVVLELPTPAEVYVHPGDLWILGTQRLLCGDATNPDDVARLLDGATPPLLATDPPYGVQLDQTWRDAAGYNALGPAEAPYMQIAGHATHERRPGYRNTTLSGDTRADWSAAFALVPSLQAGYIWYASAHTLEVLEGLRRIGFELVQQIIWDKGLFAMSRSWYHWAHEPCFVVRKPGARVPFADQPQGVGPDLEHGTRGRRVGGQRRDPRRRSGRPSTGRTWWTAPHSRPPSAPALPPRTCGSLRIVSSKAARAKRVRIKRNRSHPTCGRTQRLRVRGQRAGAPSGEATVTSRASRSSSRMLMPPLRWRSNRPATSSSRSARYIISRLVPIMAARSARCATGWGVSKITFPYRVRMVASRWRAFSKDRSSSRMLRTTV